MKKILCLLLTMNMSLNVVIAQTNTDYEIIENLDINAEEIYEDYNINISDIDVEHIDFMCKHSNNRYLNAGYGKIYTKGIASSSSLNIRTSPSTYSQILASIKNGEEVIMSFYRSGSSNQWWRYICTYNSSIGHIDGYVLESYLSDNVNAHTAGSASCRLNNC